MIYAVPLVLAQQWGQPYPPQQYPPQQYPPQQYPQQQQYPPQLQPPPPLGPQPVPNNDALPPSEQGGSDRGLEWVWARAEVGASYMNVSLDSKLSKASSGGLLLGLAAGARFLFFTLGARVRLHELVDYNLWQISPMLGLHIPSGNWDFGGDLYLGYAQIGSFNVKPPPTFSPSGFHIGVEGGLDYYVVKFFSLGVTAGFEMLFLGGGGVSTTGLSFNLTPHAALHF